MNGHLTAKTPVRPRRLLQGSPRELVVLAPSTTDIPPHFTNVRTDAARYDKLLDKMQMLRGSVYLQDGAIQSNELSDQRHRLEVDDRSWHLLILDSTGGVCGCARYREHPGEADFSHLSVSRSALASCSEWGDRFRSSVDAELALSRSFAVPYVELGGWALLQSVRCTTEALRLALSTYGLAQALGGGVGISTATSRNSSALILRRLGGQPLEYKRRQVPSYYDPQFRCEMEVLRFYSWAPNPRYTDWIAEIKSKLRNVPVLTKGASDKDWSFRRVRPLTRMPEPTVLAENSRSCLM